MRLSKTSAQAALAMAYLAEQEPGVVVQARHVASHLGIPTDSALKILQVLARHELVMSQLGRSGGYRLHKSADQVTLAQIHEAFDGPINRSMRLLARSDSVSVSLDLLQDACDEAADCLRQQLNKITVATLIRPRETSDAARLAPDAEATATI